MLRAHVTHVPICTAALRACKHVLALSDEPLKVFLRMRGTQVKARTARACETNAVRAFTCVHRCSCASVRMSAVGARVRRRNAFVPLGSACVWPSMRQ